MHLYGFCFHACIERLWRSDTGLEISDGFFLGNQDMIAFLFSFFFFLWSDRDIDLQCRMPCLWYIVVSLTPILFYPLFETHHDVFDDLPISPIPVCFLS